MTDSIQFQEWPKIPRLYRDVIITEKIDGTNAAVGVTDGGIVYAQSRKRIITPASDNFGFAAWVYENSAELKDALGPGLHFGEWCGKGIQRGYGLPTKVFALFNVVRWRSTPLPTGVTVVPTLYEGIFSEHELKLCLHDLRVNGSRFAKQHQVALDLPVQHQPAEGVIIYHKQGNLSFKVTLEGDEQPKGFKR